MNLRGEHFATQRLSRKRFTVGHNVQRRYIKISDGRGLEQVSMADLRRPRAIDDLRHLRRAQIAAAGDILKGGQIRRLHVAGVVHENREFHGFAELDKQTIKCRSHCGRMDGAQQASQENRDDSHPGHDGP
jgi:hypothetical protein